MVIMSVLFDYSMLQELKDQMLPICMLISQLAMGIALLGSLWYIASMILEALAKADQAMQADLIDYYKLLKPFTIAMCIASFDVLVIGGLDTIVTPVCNVTSMIAQTQIEETDEMQAVVDKMIDNEPLTEEEVFIYQAISAPKNDVLEEKEPSLTPAKEMENLKQSLKGKKAAISSIVMSCITDLFSWILNLISSAATMGIGIASTFFLIILSILGPLAFAASCFPAFESSISSWLARYVSISLWIPIGHIFGAMMSRVQLISLNFQANNLEEGVPAMSGVLSICISIVGVYGMLSIPTIADWIVQSGGTGSYSKNLTSGASTVGGKATGAVQGAAAKGFNEVKNKFKRN